MSEVSRSQNWSALTFERRVKGKASRSYKQIAEEGDEEYAIMAILPAIVHSLESEVDEEQVGQGVDDLRRVACRIVILSTFSYGTFSVSQSLVSSTSSHQSNVEVMGAQ